MRKMSQTTVYILLACALLLPLLAALALRLLGERLSQQFGNLIAGLLVALAIGSVFLLAQANIGRLNIGNLTLVLPNQRSEAAPIIFEAVTPDTELPTVAVPPTLTPRPSATAVPTRTPTPEPTATATPESSPTLEPTATPEPTAIPEPTATPESPPAESSRQTYTVQPGDTLRSIAEDFGVSVADLLAANDLTPEEADTIRPGQELVIP